MTRAPSTNPDLLGLRLRNSRLSGALLRRAEQVVAWFGAVQAQDYAGAKWALGQRLHRALDTDVERALDAGTILRTHVLRPTWHFVLPADIRWMLKLTAPRVRAFMAHYDRKLELDDATFRRSNAVIVKALQGGKSATRSELGQALERAKLSASGQRLGHLMMRAELDQLICSGPRRGKQSTYALLDERAPATRELTRDEALAELTRRYVKGHGPCQARDFAWWSGLTVADAKAGLELVKGELEQTSVAGKSYWFSATSPARRSAPSLHLLSNYDEYLIAYKDHALVLDGTPVGALSPQGNVLANHIVVMAGQVIGGWRRTVSARSVTIETRLLVPLSATARDELRAASERYATFLGLALKCAPEQRRVRG